MKELIARLEAEIVATENELKEMFPKQREAETNAPIRRCEYGKGSGTGGASGSAGEDIGPPQEIDKKDVEKPQKYDMKPASWRLWSIKFATFLTRRDARWKKVLGAVQKHDGVVKGKPVDDIVEDGIFRDLNLFAYRDIFKEQLFEYLESFTTGMAHSLVMAGQAKGVLEAWR